MQPDIDKYMARMEDFDLSIEHKTDFIHTLWNTMTACKDMAFGISPVQQAMALQDQNDDKPRQPSLESDNTPLSAAFYRSRFQKD
ncbi:MAG: hypothetical protein GQ535_17095 [Rhodobacteraceae bacterium]|nr:hypothetical protein [Paracoccaceae bacterium]